MGRAGDSETSSQGGTLTPETRAALEWAYDYAATMTLAADHPTDKKLFSSYARTLQGLLDGEKGGDCPARRTDSLHPIDGRAVAGAASTAPPDSPAKIAVDLRELVVDPKTSCQAELAIIAARVEALGLLPWEREKVAAIKGNLETILEDIQNYHHCPCCDRSLKTAIAALAPIAGAQAMTPPDKPSLKERIDSEAAFLGELGEWPALTERLRAIAAELGEIAEEMREPWAPSMYRTTKAEGLAYADRLCHLWADRLAKREP